MVFLLWVLNRITGILDSEQTLYPTDRTSLVEAQQHFATSPHRGMRLAREKNSSGKARNSLTDSCPEKSQPFETSAGRASCGHTDNSIRPL